MDIIGPSKQNLHGQLRLIEETNTTLTNAGQYYKIAGTMSDGHAAGFIVTDNKLKYTGPSGTCFHFSGVCDLQVDKACNTVFSLYKNGELVTGAQTPHTFVSPSKTGTIAITAIVELSQDDELEVYAKSDEAVTLMTVETLNIVFWG